MASRYDYLSDALGFLHDARRADVLSLARGDAQLAKKLTDAASIDDGGKSLRAIVADMQWGRSPAAPAPEVPVQRATREPVSGMEWSARPDSYVQRTARDMADSLPPELAARVRAGDVDAAYEAIRRGPPRAGKKPPSTEDSIRELSKPADQVAAEAIASQFDKAAYNPRPDNPQARSRALKVARESYPAEYDIAAEDLMAPDLLDGMTPQYRRLLQELEKNEWLGFDYPSQAVSSVLEYGDAPSRWDMTPELLEARDAMIFASGPTAPPRPARQMELPLTDQPTGMIPYGVRGPGVPGDLRGPGVPVSQGTDLIPSPPRRIGGQTRELSVPAERPYRVVDEVKPKNNRLAKAAAAAALTGGAAYWALQNAGDIGRKSTAEESAVESGGAADLAAETSPPPAIAATPDVPEPTVVQAPQDYSMQARALINRLNDMRRAAGGEVPEAPAMMKEINRLMALGNQTRRATMVAAPQDDAGRLYQQAQALIDQVNQMYRQGMTPNSPQVQRVMAQVRQLQSQGDAMRNRRAG